MKAKLDDTLFEKLSQKDKARHVAELFNDPYENGDDETIIPDYDAEFFREQLIQLCIEFLGEEDISLAEIIGVLEVTKTDLLANFSINFEPILRRAFGEIKDEEEEFLDEIAEKRFVDDD